MMLCFDSLNIRYESSERLKKERICKSWSLDPSPIVKSIILMEVVSLRINVCMSKRIRGPSIVFLSDIWIDVY